MGWELFEDGITIANEGPWGGVILWDMHHPRGARLTTELASRFAVVTVTLRLFGRVEKVRHFDELSPAEAWYDWVMSSLGAALDQEPAVGDPDVRSKAVEAARALSDSLAAVAAAE